MTLLSVERIKLFSTRSPYWCLVGIVGAALLFAVLMGLIDSGRQASTFLSQTGMQFGMMIFMVLAALAVTTEYRFGTIRVTFLGVPRRPAVLAAKTGLLVFVSVLVALVCAFAAFFLTKVLAAHPDEPLALANGTDWRMVAGHAALFAIAAVIAVAVGTLVRQSAGAITILLLWPLLLENLVQLIPNVGRNIHNWMPFTAGANFVAPPPSSLVFGQVVQTSGPSPAQGLLVFAATAVVLWILALIVVQKRDA